jgi:MoaF C-terminal domain
MKSLLTAFIALFLVSSCKPGTESGTKFTITPKELVGKTIEYQYGESIYHVTLETDTKMHWEAMAGDEKGTYEEETYIIESVDDSKIFITWGEANGIGVSQILDFEDGIVYNHLLRGRDATMGRGSIKILP